MIRLNPLIYPALKFLVQLENLLILKPGSGTIGRFYYRVPGRGESFLSRVPGRGESFLSRVPGRVESFLSRVSGRGESFLSRVQGRGEASTLVQDPSLN